jgi:hypothetical protein
MRFLSERSGYALNFPGSAYYVAGDTFQVLDGNCTDSNGCTIEVPSESGG